MGIENLREPKDVSKKELETTDYQVTRTIETILPQLIKLLKDNGEDVSKAELEHGKIDTGKRARARKHGRK